MPGLPKSRYCVSRCSLIFALTTISTACRTKIGHKGEDLSLPLDVSRWRQAHTLRCLGGHRPPGMRTRDGPNKEIVEAAYASFAQGDVPAALGAMADDIEWNEAAGFPLAGTYIGHQAVVEGVFMRLAEIGDDFAVVPEQLVADGDTVVALGNYTWKQKSSGEPAVVKMVHVWTMDDGKAVAFQQHVDTVRVRELS
jgi:uncharacterized protein